MTTGPTPPDATGTDGVQAIAAAMTARASVRAWAADAQVLALLAEAHDAGWLAHLLAPVGSDELARRTGVPRERVADVLTVLVAAGVVHSATAPGPSAGAGVDEGVGGGRADGGGGGAYALTPAFVALARGASGVDLDVVLADAALQHRRVRAALSPGGAGELSSQEALVLARDWGLQASEGSRALYRMIYQTFPEVDTALAAGGPFLDLGSGVGGALVTTATLYPALSATGVEVATDVAAELQRRVDAAEVADRVQVRAVDARSLEASGGFAVAYWAQEFFAAEARAEVLAVLVRVLRPGGLLLLQELGAHDGDTHDTHDTHDTGEDAGVVKAGTGVEAAVDRLFYRGLGAQYGVGAQELAREAEAAGLKPVAVRETPVGRLVLVRRP